MLIEHYVDPARRFTGPYLLHFTSSRKDPARFIFEVGLRDRWLPTLAKESFGTVPVSLPTPNQRAYQLVAEQELFRLPVTVKRINTIGVSNYPSQVSANRAF